MLTYKFITDILNTRTGTCWKNASGGGMKNEKEEEDTSIKCPVCSAELSDNAKFYRIEAQKLKRRQRIP